MRKSLILVYGVTCYAIGMASLVYMMGWLGNVGVPRSIDSPAAVPIATAILTNLTLFAVFCVQHSVMARPRFKTVWTRFVPQEAERSTYVLFSGIALMVMMVCWQPMGGVVWRIDGEPFRAAVYALYATGWGILVGSTFALNHFELFGLRQVWLQFAGKPHTHLEFATPGPYRLVRHPIYVGWITLAWATPTMTVAHLAFALATTTYILAAITLEERDLVACHGEEYEAYQRSTPKLIPRLATRGGLPGHTRYNGERAEVVES